jgi:hypothetical protein
METILVVLIAYGVFILTGQLALAFMLSVYGGTRVLSPAELQALWVEGRWQGAGVIVATLPAIAVLWVAIRLAGREFAEYLALKWPTRREVLRALGVVTIIIWPKVSSHLSSAHKSPRLILISSFAELAVCSPC